MQSYIQIEVQLVHKDILVKYELTGFLTHWIENTTFAS